MAYPEGTGNSPFAYPQTAPINLATAAGQTARLGQIESLIMQVGKQTAELHELLYALEQRLSPAIPQPPPKTDPANGPKDVGPVLAPLASHLNDTSQGLLIAQRRVRELLDTIEL